MLLVKIKIVFDRKKEIISTKDKGKLELYIYDPNTNKKLYLSTKISVLQNQYDSTKGEIGKIVKHPNSTALNGEITRLYRGIEDFSLSDKCKVIADIKNWDVKVGDKTNVLEFIREELKRRNPSLNVIKRHNTLIKRIEQHGKIKTFSDLTYENIVSFDRFLRNGNGSDVKGIDAVTAHKRHTAFKSYIVEAINLGLCDYNPYLTFKPNKGKSKDPVFLTEGEMIAIANFDILAKTQNEKLAKIKDIFVFQSFTGLSYIDLKTFNKNKISEINGQKTIRSNRQKTGEEYTSVLLPIAIQILEKYDYKLPVPSNQKYNDYLKSLPLHIVDKDGNLVIKNKVLASHTARHSYATFLINRGVPIETVARILGHSSTRMTRHYARMLATTVVDDVTKYILDNPDMEQVVLRL